jgi:hypothetical protein
MPDPYAKDSQTKPVGPDLDEQPWYGKMTTGIDRIANHSERQREQPAPGVLDLSPAGGAVVIKQSHVQMRVIGFIITSVAAEQFTLQIGGIPYTFYVVAGMEPMINFPITIDRGKDITVTNVAGHVTFSCYLFYYPE